MRQIEWRFLPAKASVPAWIDTWQASNARWNAGHPLLDPKFVVPLVENFATADARYAECSIDGEVAACMLLERASAVRWRLFTPSQACLGSSLVSPAVGRDRLLAAMTRLSGRLPGGAVIIDLLKQDPVLSPLLELRGERLSTEVVGTTCGLRLESSFDAYWSARPKKVRQDVRRVERRLDAQRKNASLRTVERADEMPGGVARHGQLESAGWKGRAGTAVHAENVQGRFYGDVMSAFAKEGGAAIYQLWIDETLAASLLTVRQGGVIVILKTAYDETLRELSPGRYIDYLVLRELLRAPSGAMLETYMKAETSDLHWYPEHREIRHVTLYRWPQFRSLRRLRDSLVRRMRPSPGARDGLAAPASVDRLGNGKSSR